MVLKLLAAGYVDHLYDWSARDEGPHGFEALHVLHRLGTENGSAWKAEDPDLTDPNREWYHETPNEAVAHWVRLLRPLVQRGQKDGYKTLTMKMARVACSSSLSLIMCEAISSSHRSRSHRSSTPSSDLISANVASKLI